MPTTNAARVEVTLPNGTKISLPANLARVVQYYQVRK